ncbi:MAG: hypothetical protein DME25_13775, partial [Verrucomicrobia bacterium]
MRIRQRAQFELARRGDDRPLWEIAQSSSAPQLARVHALWGLAQLRRELRPEQLPFADADPEIRAQSSKTAGDLHLRAAVPSLLPLLADASLRVRFHAALSLGKVGDDRCLSALAQMLAANADGDPFLRHAGVMGLAGCGQPEALAQFAHHPSAAVRTAAVLALRRLRSPTREAVRAIHDDQSIPEALPALAALGTNNPIPADEAVMRRVLNANLRLGTADGAQRLIRFATDARGPEAMRVEAIECLGAWNLQPCLDRVEGMIRTLSDRRPTLGDQRIQDNLAELLASTNLAITKAVGRIVMQHHLPVDLERFAAWAISATQPSTVRSQALELLADAGFARLGSILQQALEALTAMRLVARNNPEAFLEFLDTRESRMTLPEKQAARRLAGQVKSKKAVRFLQREMNALLLGQVPAELALDVLEGCRARPDPELKTLLATYESK